jgi:ATPase subunit of ABC transporter with duplicated ATPase domains
MKLCRTRLHYYWGKQCLECRTIWWNKVKDSKKEAKRLYDKANRAKFSVREKKQRNSKREEYLAYLKEYRTKNRAKRTAFEIKRQKAKIQRVPPWLTELHLAQIELFYDAANKLTKEFGMQMDVDHIVPLQGKNVSGLHVPWNLQVIPHKDNMIKGNKHG